MELYLRWLEKYGKEPGEKTPLGLILCAGKASEQIELLELDKSGMNLAAFGGTLFDRIYKIFIYPDNPVHSF